MYIQIRNELKKLTREAANRQDIEVLPEAGKNPMTFWNKINRRLEARRQCAKPAILNGALTAKDKERAKTLLNIFASVFPANWNAEAPEPVATPVSTLPNDKIFSVERVRKEMESAESS